MTVNVLHRWLSLRDIVVSIHTPIQGVTSFRALSQLIHIGFNPHTHTGCDSSSAVPSKPSSSFNPHTHTGCDTHGRARWLGNQSFNPHTHTGCDQATPLTQIMILCFNPHTHTGCDIHNLL